MLDKNVQRLNVAMENKPFMKKVHPEANLDEERHDYFLRDVLLLNLVLPHELLQVAGLAVLHHDINLGPRNERVVVLYDLGAVCQLRHNVDFVHGFKGLILWHQVSLQLFNHEIGRALEVLF